MRQKFPSKYEPLLKDLSNPEVIEVFFNVGNTHRALDDKHQWTAFVENAGDKNLTRKFIEKVRFGQHEMFGFKLPVRFGNLFRDEYRDERAPWAHIEKITEKRFEFTTIG